MSEWMNEWIRIIRSLLYNKFFSHKRIKILEVEYHEMALQTWTTRSIWLHNRWWAASQWKTAASASEAASWGSTGLHCRHHRLCHHNYWHVSALLVLSSRCRVGPCASCLIQSICRPSFTVLQLAVATIATSVLVTPTKVSTEGDTLNFTHKETALVPVSLLPVLSAISLSPVCCHEIWNPTQCRRRGCFREAHCDVTVRDALSWTRMRMECISEIFSDVRKFKVLGGRRCDRDADSAISFSIRHHYILFCNAVSRGQVPDFQIIMLL